MSAPQGWRYRKGDVDQGSIGWAALRELARRGDLSESDWVFSPAKGAWVKAWEVPGLFGSESGAPPVSDEAARRRQRIIMTVIAVDAAVTAIVGIVLFVLLAR